MANKKNIAVHIQSEVQFYSIEPLLKELDNSPYKITILIEKHSGNKDGWQEMSNGVVRLMKKKGYIPKYTEYYCDKEFDLCLTPYMDRAIKAKCYLKYEYGGMRIKPVSTHTPAVLSGFSGFLCTNLDEVNLFSAYGKTFMVDSLRFINKKHQKKNNDKKIVLFAPTFNDDYTIDELSQMIKILKKKYYVIVKSHHGINYLKKNRDKKGILENGGADEYYDSDTNIVDLIMRVDVCLTGNSGVISDALYAGVPCVVFTHDLNRFKWRNLNTIQFEMNEAGQLLSFDNPKNVNSVVEKALTSDYRKRWRQFGEIMIPKKYCNGVKGYLEVLEYFLNNPEAKEYITIHELIWDDLNNVVNEKDAELRKLRDKCGRQKIILDDFKKRKLYKIADVAYNWEGKIIQTIKRRKG